MASLDNGLSDCALEPGFARMRIQAREEVRRHEAQRAERQAHHRAAHKITAEFAAWKQRFDEETSAEIDVVFAAGWNCCSQLGLTALDCTPQPGEGQSSSSDDDDDEGGAASHGGQAVYATTKKKHRKKHKKKPDQDQHVPAHALGAGAAGERARGPMFGGRCLWVPRACGVFKRRHVTQVACGGRHTLLYCEGYGLCVPELYAWGRNTSGQLGLAGGRAGEQLGGSGGAGGGRRGRKDSSAAKLRGRGVGIPYGCPDEDALRAAARGAMQGEVARPTILPRFVGLRISHLALGEAHSVVSVATQAAGMPEGVDDHALFAFGSNEHGQLGLGDHFLGHDARWCGSDHFAPCAVMCLHRSILFVACGEGHTAVATAANLTEPAHVMTCGDNRLGQLGVGAGDRDARRVLTEVPPLDGKQVNALACGATHTLAATASNAFEGACLWAWGCNTHGQLGLGHASCDGCELPRRVLFSQAARAERDAAEKEFLKWEVVRTGNALLIQRMVKRWLQLRRWAHEAAASKIQARLFRGPSSRALVAELASGKKKRKKRGRKRGNDAGHSSGSGRDEARGENASANNAFTAVRGARRNSYSSKMLNAGKHIVFGPFCSRWRPLTAKELQLGSGFAGGHVVSCGAGLNHSMVVVAPPAWELSADDALRGWTERTDGVAKGVHVLWGFGDHAWGQLGIGAAKEEMERHRPTLLPTPVRSAWMEEAGGPRDVTCGRFFTLVLVRGEPLPQLPQHERDKLLRVPPTKRATLQQQRAAAVKQRDGAIFAFGDNQYGQLGIGPPRGPGRSAVHGGTGTDLRSPEQRKAPPRPPAAATGCGDSDSDSEGSGNPATRAALRRASMQVLNAVKMGRAGGTAPRPGMASTGLFRDASKPPPVPYERCIHEPRPIGFVPNGGCRIGAAGVPGPTGSFVKLPTLGPGACHSIFFKDVDPGRLGDDAEDPGGGVMEEDGGVEAQDPQAKADRAAYELVIATQKAQREKARIASGGLANLEAGAHPMSGGAMERKSHMAEHKMAGFLRELGVAAKPADWYIESKLNPRFRDGAGRPDAQLRNWGGRQRFVDDTFKEIAAQNVADAAAAQKSAEFERLRAAAHAELQADTRARAAKADADRKAQFFALAAHSHDRSSSEGHAATAPIKATRVPKYI